MNEKEERKNKALENIELILEEVERMLKPDLNWPLDLVCDKLTSLDQAFVIAYHVNVDHELIERLEKKYESILSNYM